MITQAFMTALHGFATTIFAGLGALIPEPPTFWSDIASAVTTAFGIIPDPVRYFVPLGPVVVAGASLVGLLVVLGTLRLARRAVSLFTGGGGMA